MHNCMHFENQSWLTFISLQLYTWVKLCLQVSADEFRQPMSLYEIKLTVKIKVTTHIYVSLI